MRNYIKLLLLLLFSACGQRLELNGFDEYVKGFEVESSSRGNKVTVTNLIIEFTTKLNQYTYGVCLLRSNDTPRIQINKNVWFYLSDATREELMFHELGHCVLFRKHEESVNNGAAISIMYPYILNDIFYSNNRSYYLDELFSRKNEF